MYLKPQPFINRKNNTLFAVLIFAVSLFVYYLTHARSLSFWDAGEYITCSSILGIPHPPGNPFYILLGRFFTIFDFGFSHAQVVNFLSGILSSFAVMFTYLFTVKLITMWLKSETDAYIAYLGGFIAAIYTAFSFTFWTNAIEAEVYSGLVFTINLVIWLTLVWVEKSKGLSHQNILILIIYIFFLGFSIHQTSLQIAPAVLFIVVYPLLKDNIKSSKFWTRAVFYTIGLLIIYLIFNEIGKNTHLPALAKYMFAITFVGILYFHLKKEVASKVWLFALFVILVGLSTHLFLYIRSEFRPFINEGHPHNLKLFTDYVLRRQYGPTSMFVRRATFLYQIKEQFLQYFSWQFFHAETLARWFRTPQLVMQTISNLIVTLLGFGGAYYHYKKNKHSFAYFFSFFFMASLAMVFVMNLSDTEVRERDYFYVTAYNFWTVWMAIGSLGLISYFRKKSKPLFILIIILVLGLPILNFASQYHIHDRHKEFIALDYGQNILNSVEENAIIFTNGDNDTFPVWYAQAVADPNVTENIYPARDVFPTEKTKEDIARGMKFKNEQCEGIRKDITIANLSLLNTGWYIKQLRDNEGIEFVLRDKHGNPLPLEKQDELIDLCQESPKSPLYPMQMPKDVKLRIKGKDENDFLEVEFKKGKILYVKDLATLQIIKDNYRKRPIYFAVTTPDAIGFENYLRNEGMIDRLVSSQSDSQYDIQRLTTNIDSIYSYRGIFDETLYKDNNMIRLLNNYGAAFMRASQHYHKQKDYPNAIKYMEKGINFIQDKGRFYSGLSQLYIEAGYYFIENDNVEQGFLFIEDAIQFNKTNENLPFIIYQAAVYANSEDKGIELLEKLKAYQDTAIINSYIENMK
ncbi:MAG: DUF2723 domain-containing protein [Armatimonadetes bacterium]|nr:DUF2723 domain-containing protein [Armatimonadota bacterium]